MLIYVCFYFFSLLCCLCSTNLSGGVRSLRGTLPRSESVTVGHSTTKPSKDWKRSVLHYGKTPRRYSTRYTEGVLCSQIGGNHTTHDVTPDGLTLVNFFSNSKQITSIKSIICMPSLCNCSLLTYPYKAMASSEADAQAFAPVQGALLLPSSTH